MWLVELVNLVIEKIKFICLNNVNNFIGMVLDREMLSWVVEIVCEVGVYVLVDEVYYLLMKNGMVCLIVDFYEWGIVIDFLLKIYLVLGLWIGWMVMNWEVVDCL